MRAKGRKALPPQGLSSAAAGKSVILGLFRSGGVAPLVGPIAKHTLGRVIVVGLVIAYGDLTSLDKTFTLDNTSSSTNSNLSIFRLGIVAN